MQPRPYSYRDDPDVPAFDDRHSLVVFDGQCVLCSRSMRLLLRLDTKRRFRLTTAQGPLGQALYRHAGLPAECFEIYLAVLDGEIRMRSDAIISIARLLPWPGRAGVLLRVLPRPLRDAAYLFVARRRYRLFGRTSHCSLLMPDIGDRLV